MNEREKIIAAYVCSNEKLPDKRCEKCPFGYEYLDQTGDNYFVGCNTERMMVDAIDLLRAQKPVKPSIGGDADGMHGNWWYTCGACHEQIDRGDKYCRWCGRAVKWE